MTPNRIIIDTDPGIDDAMAILLAMADPRIELMGLTCIFGNVPVERATRNALWLTEIARHPCLVAQGARHPLMRPPQDHPDFVHGVEGFGAEPAPAPRATPDPRGAARFLCESVAEHPGEITLIAVGPLTNLAEALAHDPAIARGVKGVIVMGGALRVPGNVTSHAEANIWQDPEAAAAVFAADWPVTLVGLDVTEAVHGTAADFAAIARAAPEAGGFLDRAVQFYFAFHRDAHGLDGCHMHDPTAVIALTDPGLFTIHETPVRVITEGAEAGRTVEGGTGPRLRACLGVDAAAVMEVYRSTLSNGRLP
ncbi:nucleoside hydrolase [Limibaculum sp. M0105]|uniref:Nucleoside hydrolase n=1 Tax=Thermohalobaculum xanthum TaxID=2753746 RepID=A0A8J7M8V1_9RHOB|nr:nucleoside hydrolase [Thermohalobaculum xanthum]MBK0400268.1 nucleoside hydrolase [Thermohalobaculum xanthum]